MEANFNCGSKTKYSSFRKSLLSAISEEISDLLLEHVLEGILKSLPDFGTLYRIKLKNLDCSTTSSDSNTSVFSQVSPSNQILKIHCKLLCHHSITPHYSISFYTLPFSLQLDFFNEKLLVAQSRVNQVMSLTRRPIKKIDVEVQSVPITVERETQTIIKNFVENFTQHDHGAYVEAGVQSTVETCEAEVQADIFIPTNRNGVEVADMGTQYEVESEPEEEEEEKARRLDFFDLFFLGLSNR